MTSYHYPASENAKGTHLSEGLIKTNDNLEAQIFQQVHGIIGDTEGSIVDIGAGEGRYSVLFGTRALHITVIEPDAARLARAEANLGSSNATVCGVEGGVLDAGIAPGSVDLALNVHVLQHIHSKAATDILDKAAEWLRPGGKLVLCFTKRTTADSEYNLSWKEDGKIGYGPIPREVFERIVDQPFEGTLPVHKLDKSAVKQQLEERDLEIIYEEDYTPRLLDMKRSRLGRLAIACYKKMNPMLVNKLQKSMGYKKFVDTCIVAQKR